MHRTGLPAIVSVTLIALLSFSCSSSKPSLKNVPPLKNALDAKTDVYGDIAIGSKEGPTYEFFESLLPPLRYPDASFRDYPITLSAPRGVVKARFVSNGSAVNALGRTRKWVGEVGTPCTFHVGSDMEVFGANLSHVTGPTYAQGYLPIVEVSYDHRDHTFSEEAFASVDPAHNENNCVVFVRLSVSGSKPEKQKVEAWFDGFYETDKKGNLLTLDDHKVTASFDADKWEFSPARCCITAYLAPGESATLAIQTRNTDKPLIASMNQAEFDEQYNKTVETWNKLLDGGMQIHVPEPVAQNAWRATLIGNFMLINQNLMRYSAGNQYQGLYIGEGGDSTRCLALYGQESTARDVMPPLFNFTRKNLEYHQAGFKLQMIAHYYLLTRDAEWLRKTRPLWERELNVILKGRDPATGMFPPEKYAGDLPEKVPSLNSNSNCWRALRDMSFVLDDLAKHPTTQPVATLKPEWPAMAAPATQAQKPTTTASTAPVDPELAHLARRDESDGPLTNAASLRIYPTDYSKTTEADLSKLLSSTAAEYRKVILANLDKAVNRSVDPPYYPLDLSGKEKPYSPITATSPGSYWNIMIQYSLGSGVFPYNSDHATNLLNYLRTQGGVFMGMNRANLHHTQWNAQGAAGVNDLYSLRRAIVDLERDDVDHFLVSVYGKLAQGMTRDTFIGGEGSCIVPLDEFGRMLTLPPNSCANAYYLWMQRYMLVQDFDLDDSGSPETLRLLFATPRAWLDDHKSIAVQNAPTAFGSVSVSVLSKIKTNEVIANLQLPPGPAKTLLRLRLPGNVKITSAIANTHDIPIIDAQTLDLTGLTGAIHLVARTK